MNRKGKSGSVFNFIFVVGFLYASDTGGNNLFVQLKKDCSWTGLISMLKKERRILTLLKHTDNNIHKTQLT